MAESTRHLTHKKFNEDKKKKKKLKITELFDFVLGKESSWNIKVNNSQQH